MSKFIEVLGEKIKLVKVEGSKCESTGRCDYKVYLLNQGPNKNMIHYLGYVGPGWFRNGGLSWSAYSKYVRPFATDTRHSSVRALVRKYFESIGEKPACYQ